ncbi:MAG: hypothetical protein JRN24_02120, partial [Nitrososphaerota archaeon]|nr:hypothetical protein [Nitrososphaerota archaeon]
VQVEIRALEAARATEEPAEDLDVVFNVNASISETDRGDGFVVLKYSVDLETNPAAARLRVSGTARVSGRDEEVEKLAAGKEKDGTPTLFMKIYQKVYPTMYLLCGCLKIPYPAPGLLRLNGTATEEELVQRAGAGIPR